MPTEAHEKRASALPTGRITTRTVTPESPRQQGPPPSAENVARSVLRQTRKRKL